MHDEPEITPRGVPIDERMMDLKDIERSHATPYSRLFTKLGLSDDKIVAIVIGDLCLSETAPIYRRDEANWLDAQAFMISQVASLAESSDAPIISVGSIFNNWDVSPALFKFASRVLPDMYVFPGPNDIQFGRCGHIEDSWVGELPGVTLINGRSGIRDFAEFTQIDIHTDGITLSNQYAKRMQITYVHNGEYGDIPTRDMVLDAGYDVVLSDGWMACSGTTTIHPLIEREPDENAGYCYLILASGDVHRHPLRTARNKYTKIDDLFRGRTQKSSRDLSSMLDYLDRTATTTKDIASLIRWGMTGDRMETAKYKQLLEQLDIV
jgi:hypothetical protein